MSKAKLFKQLQTVEGGGSDDQGDDDDCAIDLTGDAPLFTVADPQHFGV